MVVIKTSTDNKCWGGCGEREPSCAVGGSMNGCSHYGQECGGSLKTKNKTTRWPSNPTTGPALWENYNETIIIQKDPHPAPRVQWSTIYNSQDMKASKMSIIRWMDKDVAHICNGIFSCNPMNYSMPGLPVHHQLPEFTQTHVHRVGDAIQASHPLPSPSPPAPNPSQHQSLFQWVNSSHEVAKALEFQL